ncbi:MAG: hypothetical protein KF869_00160 [Phycisphaeraceae bacterium]|nr:hypothetical protein [Phycisphaeraceae bacterium]
MNARRVLETPTRAARPRARQRGGTYLLVLGMGTMLTVIGLSIGVAGRIAARTTAAERDWAEAGVLAQAGAELALVTINNESKWRAIRPNNNWNPAVTIGNGRVAWKLSDESDNDLSNSRSDPVLVTAEAGVGAAQRRFSVRAVPGVARGLPVLSAGLYSGSTVTISAPLSVSGGPIGTAATLNNSAALSADVNALTVINTGTIAGFVTTPAAAMSTPTTDVLYTYQPDGTQISFASIPSGRIENQILSASNNPYGAQNAAGVYFIRVPASSTLRIRDSIIRATLLVQLQAGAKLVIDKLVAWDPPSAGMPSLITVGDIGSEVTVSPDAGTVTVTAAQLNALGIQIGLLTLASAPSELHGLFHVAGDTTTTFQSSPQIVGTWISDGPVTIGSATKIVVDPQLAANPPAGYSIPNDTMTAIPGSFSWQSR